MSTRSLIGRRVGLLGATAALLAGAGFTLPQAQAAPAAASSADKASAVAESMRQQLGSTRTAGSYIDRASGKLVVTVTDSAAARLVRAAGAEPKTVTRSGAQLQAVTNTLKKTATIPGTAWAVDPSTNQVLVSADSTVTGAKLAKLQKATKALGSAVRVEKVPGTFSTRISGGDPIYGSAGRCSLGFSVVSGSTYYFLTAGHCTDVITAWYSNSSLSTRIGTTAGSSFPGNDYGIVRWTGSGTPSGNVNLYTGSYQDISSAATPTVGQTVRRSGSTTGVRSGTVTALNSTVNYAEGTVSGLIRTTVCAEPGDSGGSLYSGTVAYGLTSGGSGNCTSGGVTYFQPVTEALSAYGVSIF